MSAVLGGIVVAVLSIPVLVVVGFLLTVAWNVLLFGAELAKRALR